MECGTALGRRTPAPARGGASPAEAPPEERRQATVLFADLSGYTAAAERMDPEAVKALVDRTLRRLGDEIERFGGSIDKFIGDNVMGVFGAPTAHEDDPERAVRAGLAMQDAMEGANRESQEKYGVEFSLRVGINSGEVMAGAVGRPLHGDGRRSQRRRAAAGGRAAGERHGRRADLPGHRRGDLLRAARAAHAQGQGGAGSGLGGDGRALRAAAQGRPRADAPDRPRGGGGAALLAGRSGSTGRAVRTSSP